MDKAWDVASQIEQRVHLHRRFGGPETGPGEHRHAQIDGRGIQRLDGVGEVHAQAFVGIEPSGLSDQPLGELGIDAPIARLVGIGKRGTADRFAKPHVVEFGCLGGQAGLNVTQTLAVRQLGERHDLILSGAGQLSHRVVAVVARNNAIECASRQKIHKLREQRLPGVHRQALPSRDRPGEPQAIQIRPSNELREILVCQMLSGKFSTAVRSITKQIQLLIVYLICGTVG